MKKVYWIVFLFSLIFGFFFTKELWKQINRQTFPKELIEQIDSRELKSKLTSLEKEVLNQFEAIKKREYNLKCDKVVEMIRPLLNSENGVELGSYILGKLLLSEQLSSKNSLFVLNKLRVLKMRRQNFLESIRYCLEYIKLAKYTDSDYDVDRGKMGLSIIISSLNGYEISNQILREIIKENQNYKGSNQVKIVALLNLAENNIRLFNHDESLDSLDEIMERSKQEAEIYINSLMIIVDSLYSYNYVYLNDKEKAKYHLIRAEEFLSKRQTSYFIDEHLYYAVAESLYNLYFELESFSEEKTIEILELVENKTDFGFLYYSYEVLFEYYKKISDFEKYEDLKRKYDKKMAKINEINYTMLSLYMIESLESGISKKINDTYGHNFGDSVLRKIGYLLQIKEQQYKLNAYRIGGEEFAILFLGECCSREKCLNISEEIRRDIESLIWIRDIKVTISGGLSYRCNKVYEESDKLLYEAKRSGKNKISNNFLDNIGE
ncbi:GGDEF domain-containing protein [uncultured Cetobacterium sp.]|uniref:GGDEF domain-containing protein n=1 Tax=uncultured Cetobacterium sp. TaxID=527638 RepID=UPI0025E521A3|nr:GGDEF domain-containing protein [uncultured Cetobacterium sp.]